MGLLTIIGLIIVGYFSGRYFEKSHYKRIIEREKALRHIPVISGEWKETITPNQEAQIFGGGIVIGSDYFKTFVAGLRSLVGGRMRAYESLLDRGRREAILRMKEKANHWGAEKIVNVRIETASIGNVQGKKALPCVELYAYGTALKGNQSHEIQP